MSRSGRASLYHVPDVSEMLTAPRPTGRPQLSHLPAA